MKAEKRKKHKTKKAENKDNDDGDDQLKLEDVISLGGTQVSIFLCHLYLMQKIETQHIKATTIVKKIGIKVKDIDVLQSVNWNRIDYIYKRKVATEMHKIVKGTEGHRLSDMFETKSAKEEVCSCRLRD